MDINQKIKKEIVALLKKVKLEIAAADLELPPNPELGDWALPCFTLAKTLKKSPVEIAAGLAGQIKSAKNIVRITNQGPYVNFFVSSEFLAKNILAQIVKEKKRYGINNFGKNQRVMIEYSQPNTHKEFHVGHLRNVCIGTALVNIYKNNGYKVIPANYIGDTGAHVAKTLWYIQNYSNETDIPKDKRARGEFLGQAYTRAVAEIAEHPEFKEQAQEILKQLESGDEKLTGLWQETRQWSLDLFSEIYKELGAKFEAIFYESEEEKTGLKMVPALLKTKYIKKSEGAIIADLSEYNLGILVLVRKDGTALYGIKDLPLAIKKFKKYRIKRSLYLIDIRQKQYFQQIFKILELLGFDREMIHVPYEFVQLKSGVISSRSGNVVTYEEAKEAALAKAISETKKRHSDWSADKIKEVSLKIVLSALKFGMLKSGSDKILTFDLEESLDVNGFTGPYLQYTLARINSIFKKNRGELFVRITADLNFQLLSSQIEKNLLNKLSQYPQVVAEITSTNDPASLAQYLYALAQDFNAFYHELSILQATADLKKMRLLLLTATQQVLSNGLSLLGLPTVEEM